jgi:hypothetical protein
MRRGKATVFPTQWHGNFRVLAIEDQFGRLVRVIDFQFSKLVLDIIDVPNLVLVELVDRLGVKMVPPQIFQLMNVNISILVICERHHYVIDQNLVNETGNDVHRCCQAQVFSFLYKQIRTIGGCSQLQ